MAIILYPSAAEFIRHRRFEVLAPSFYHPDESSSTLELTKKKPEKVNTLRFVDRGVRCSAPFRQGIDPDEMQFCSYTVEIMLDMFRKKTHFEIVRDTDLPEIFDNLDRYLLTLKPDCEQGVEDSINYARLVVSWREEVYKHYYRFMRMNPTAMEELYPRNDTVENIFTLMASVSGINYSEYKDDPLLSRRNPPFDINAVIPVDPVAATGGDFDIGSSLGLENKKDLFADKGSAPKFDLQGFLGGS
jgi:hypothetical protein